MQIDKDLTYVQAIDALTSKGKFHIKLGLERISSILKLIGNPQDGLKFIHVAGTNGKGSVCAMLGSVFTNSGIKTGVFTSPHVFDYTERIKINGFEIEKDVFAELIIKIVNLADLNQIPLTEFEILTAAAFDYFKQESVEIVLLETGLGGRLDATNVIKENLCSIITHIDLDHTDRLGDTVEKIAYEKAGIIKPKCPVIINSHNAGYGAISKVAKEKSAKVFSVDEKNTLSVDYLALKGNYQKQNLALVLKALEIAGFELSKEAVSKGLKDVKHPCRFEYIENYHVLIDGAHNPNGAKALRESLDENFPNQKFKFIFGCLNNKNYEKMMEYLFKKSDEVYFYQFDNPNSCSYEDLSGCCRADSKPFSDYSKDTNTLTVICGSFYMIKELFKKMGIK